MSPWSGGVRRSRPLQHPAPKPPISVTIETGGVNTSYGTPPVVARFQLPQQSYSITSKQIEETINLKDPEDAVKYMPDLFVRKRNDGDNQAVLATRNWGLNSSARTLIFYDDILVSALIANNNTNGSPHWNFDFARSDRSGSIFSTVRSRPPIPATPSAACC